MNGEQFWETQKVEFLLVVVMLMLMIVIIICKNVKTKHVERCVFRMYYI